MCIQLHPVGVLTDVHIILLQSSNAFIVLNKSSSTPLEVEFFCSS